MVASFLVTMTLFAGAAASPGVSAPMAFGVATAAPDDAAGEDDESTGVDDLHAAQYLPAPDPVGIGHEYTAQPTGCAGLMLGFDQFCLGGLVSRAYSRSISYGLCGSIVGAIGGCFCGVLPLFIIQDGVDGINSSLTACGSPVLLAIGTSAWIIMGLLGAVPGCIGGGGCGAGLGLASAFLFPFDEQTSGSPPPNGQQPYPVDGRQPGDDGYYDDDNDSRDEPNVRRRPNRNDRASPPQKPGSGRSGRDESTSGRNGRNGREDSTSGRSGRGSTGRDDGASENNGRTGRGSDRASDRNDSTERRGRATTPAPRKQRSGSRGRTDDVDSMERPAGRAERNEGRGQERGKRRPRSEDDVRDRTDHDGDDRNDPG